MAIRFFEDKLESLKYKLQNEDSSKTIVESKAELEREYILQKKFFL